MWPITVVANAVDYLHMHEASFELITAFDSIEHFNKDEILDVLDALYRSICPGGILIVQPPNAESPFGLGIRYGDFTREGMFCPASLDHVLRLVGFTDFAARESGPYVHGLKSWVRAVIWLALRSFYDACNFVETGSRGSGIYTRVFVARGKKPE